MRSTRAALLIAVALLGGCGGDGEAPPSEAPTVAGFAFAQSGVVPGQPIDVRFSCDGEDVSPPLAWAGAPEETTELALVVDDPDADGFTHWLVYAIPPDTASLPENVPKEKEVAGPPRLRQGENDLGDTGYAGPCPPEGEMHRYVFRLFALDAALGLEPGAGRGAFDDAVAGHVLGEARLEATYARR
jgi:Raf kinase inhibitor-like YbhB/YbcL family protein